MSNNKCVRCGEIIPEGRQVCPNCESKYKRLTKEKSTTKNTKIVYNENGFAIMSKELVDMLLQDHNRLWELENKIENGTLIELPCKVGDKVFQTDGARIYQGEIQEITYTKEHTIFVADTVCFDERAIGESVFLSESEAEAKLRELEGKEDTL